MKGDILHITLKPEDFDWQNAPLLHALSRNGHTRHVINMYECWLLIKGNYVKYKIKRGFTWEDQKYVKEQYRKYPEMNKCEYYVNLIEQ